MKKLLTYSLPAIFVGLVIAAAVNAQVATPNFFKKVGSNLLPVTASTTIGSSTVNGSFKNLNLSGTCTGCSVGSATSTVGPYTVGGSQTSTIQGDGTESFLPNLAGKVYVGPGYATIGCAGSSTATDIGGCINALKAALPSSGGTIVVANVSTSYSTPIVIDKHVFLECSPDDHFHFTGSGTSSAITFNAGTGASARWGPSDCKFSGTGVQNSQNGLIIGGSLGADSLTVSGNQFRDFKEGVIVNANVNWLHFTDNTVNFNKQSFLWNGGTNAGEGIDIEGNVFADCSTQVDCATISGGMSSLYAAANHFDDGQFSVGTSGIESALLESNFWENPQALTSSGYPGYPMASFGASGGSNVTMNGGVFVQDAQGATSTSVSAIKNGALLTMKGVSFVKNGAVGWTNAVDNSVNGLSSVLDAQDTYSQNSAFTNLASTTTSVYPNSQQVIINNGQGSSVFAYQSANNSGDILTGSNVNASTPASVHVNGSGSLLIDSNVNPDGTTQTDPTKPAWRIAISQLSDAFSIQRSPATTTFNGSTLFSLSSAGVASFPSQYYSIAASTSTTANTSATTINWTNGNVQSIRLTTSTTISFTNTQLGGRYILSILQDGTGSRTVTWPSSVHWPSDAAPTLTTTAGKLDLVSFVCMGVSSTDCYGGANLNYSP